MKKILLSLIAIISTFVFIPLVNAKNDVTVYMFTKNGCPACESAREYFNGLLEDDEDAFKLVEIEVWDYDWNINNEDSYDLLIASIDKLEGNTDPAKLATPTIFIGDYYSVGLPRDTSVITDAIDNAKNSKKKVDVIQTIAEENEYDLEYLESIHGEAPSKTNSDEPGKYDAVILIGVFIILIGGFVGLVVVSKK